MDDFFCGCGGETTGAKMLGIDVRHAFNHWDIAIETHNTNHPLTTHVLADIGTYDPYKYQPSILAWFSPECKTFSQGSGKSQKPRQQQQLPGFEFEEYDLTPKQERSRVTAGDILRHVQVHRYEAIVVENVVQFRQWEKFDSWLQQMINFGYDWEIVYLNSMHCHPTPQSRDRMYTCFWRKGNRKPNLAICPRAFCPRCGRDVDAVQTRKPTSSVPYMRYREQYTYNCPTCASVVEPYYYAAANVIDWSNVGTRIGDRKRPLADNTMKRIEAGLKRFAENPPAINPAALFGEHLRDVFISPYHHDDTDRSRPLTDELPTVDGSPRFGMVTLNSTNRTQARSRLLDEPLPTRTGKNNGLLAFMPSVNYFRPNRDVDQPAPTQTTVKNYGLTTIPPLIYRAYRTATMHPATDELSTVVASGTHHWLLNQPEAFISSYYGQGGYSEPGDVLPTQTGNEHQSIVHARPSIEDCYFRMLTVQEIKEAMGFPKEYVLLGVQSEQVELAGQAVTPDAARVLLERMIGSLN